MGTALRIAGNANRNVEDHATLFGINPIIMSIIHSRGYDTPEAIDDFLHASLADMHSPFLFEGMHKAVERVRTAIDARERIGIFADSDLDGITSLAVLYTLFSRMKIEPFLRYLKDDENYGITGDIIEEFRDNGVTLIITVDSGTRDVSEIAYARSLGIDVIVTDHHEQDRDLPDAIVINPKISGSKYPFKNLAGVGVAFKLSHAILMSYLPSYKRLFLLVACTQGIFTVSYIRDCIVEKMVSGLDSDGLKNIVNSVDPDDFILLYDSSDTGLVSSEMPGKKILNYVSFIAGISSGRAVGLEDLHSQLAIKRKVYPSVIDLLNNIFLEIQLSGSEKVKDFIESVIGHVAIGSIADVISLTGENRILVRSGIDNLGRTRQKSLSLIMNGEKADSRFIGWTLAPLLNTPGRLGKTELTVDFFIAKDVQKLRAIISEIKALNEDRRLFVREFCGSVLEMIENGTLDSTGRLIHIKTDRIPEGYAGLIANRIADVTGKPVIVTVLPGRNGIVKGSGRSRGGVRFFSHFREYTDRFERIGGHENAFGFTVQADRIDEIVRLIEKTLQAESSSSEDAVTEYELDIACITTGFINDLQLLEPYGNGNSEPVFVVRNLKFESFQQFGSNHGKYFISDYSSLTAIGWGMGAHMKDLFETGHPLDISFRLENNIYSGKVTPRMIIIDIRIS